MKSIKNNLFYCLTANGHLPEFMPPPFTSSDFAGYADRYWPNVDSILIKDKGKRATESSLYVHPRVGGARRHFRVCNPLSYAELAGSLTTHQDLIRPYLANGPSLTSPNLDAVAPSGEVRQYPDSNQREVRRIRARGRAQFLLCLDVSNCFGSIYTHSVEWLIAGKSYAKEKKGKKKDLSTELLAAREIDTALRRCNAGQTVGLPIGPHTSHIIAEGILGSVDVNAGLTQDRSLRVTDDYEIYCSSRHEVEDKKSVIQDCLYSYELGVNDSKTTVIELPIPIEKRWVYVLRNLGVSGTVGEQRRSLVRLFDFAFNMVKEGESYYAVSYAISMIDVRKIHYENAFLVLDLLIHCVATDPSSMHKAFNLMIELKVVCKDYKDQIRNVIEATIERNVAARHGSEVAWAVWLAIVLEIEIDASVIRKALNLEDQASTLICLDCERRSLVSGTISPTDVRGRVADDELLSSGWLLAYEAHMHKWLNRWFGVYGRPMGEEAFDNMRRAEVRFYKSADPVKYSLRHRMASPRWRRAVNYE